jgi:hypothetical protein
MNRKTLFFLVLAALVVVLVVAVRTPAVVRAQNPTRANITLLFEDGQVRVYEDLDYGARIVVSEGGVAVYCPCGGGSCAVATTPPTATPITVALPTQGPTSTVALPTQGLTPTMAPPTVEPSPTPRPPCNQGVGNGPEGCDPGRSNHNQPSNDEGPGCGSPGNPCRR